MNDTVDGKVINGMIYTELVGSDLSPCMQMILILGQVQLITSP